MYGYVWVDSTDYTGFPRAMHGSQNRNGSFPEMNEEIKDQKANIKRQKGGNFTLPFDICLLISSLFNRSQERSFAGA
jgi:hypothetical protein